MKNSTKSYSIIFDGKIIFESENKKLRDIKYKEYKKENVDVKKDERKIILD